MIVFDCYNNLYTNCKIKLSDILDKKNINILKQREDSLKKIENDIEKIKSFQNHR